ncbi:integrase catalytic domain-containing protein [Trichonephila clavipes]|nr:integrase catalytic domain-containing protein [Trichonephila clavipes]
MFVNDMCVSDLWKLDSLGITDPVETKTKLEIQKETLNHFQKTISVDISGRYEVALPWVLDNKLLSSNRKLAENRLESTKRKLIATGKFEEYQDVLDLWLSGKIIEEVNDDKENFVHYLPHRPVIKENSTKLESQPDKFETMVLEFGTSKMVVYHVILTVRKMKEIWKLKLKWDENLPKDILNQVKKWLEQLPILASIKIPRCLNLSSNGIKRLTLHVFCDASKKAYAACVFLRVEYEENVFVKLIQAKARVAPLKDISIPRLELLACVLGTRLAASVKNDLNLPDVRIYYLTDSMTALAWIQRTRDWGVFVSNRLKEIRNLSEVSSWEHVPSEKNFADILFWAQQLVYLRWWEGPSWLSETPVQCPRSKQVPDEEAVNLELRGKMLGRASLYYEELNTVLCECEHVINSRPLTVGEVVVVENSLKNRTLWSLARVIQLIPGKDGHVRVARVKTETGELARHVQRLYNLELQEPDINLSKDLTDSVIRTRRGRKVISPKRLTYA